MSMQAGSRDMQQAEEISFCGVQMRLLQLLSELLKNEDTTGMQRFCAEIARQLICISRVYNWQDLQSIFVPYDDILVGKNCSCKNIGTSVVQLECVKSGESLRGITTQKALGDAKLRGNIETLLRCPGCGTTQKQLCVSIQASIKCMLVGIPDARPNFDLDGDIDTLVYGLKHKAALADTVCVESLPALLTTRATLQQLQLVQAPTVPMIADELEGMEGMYKTLERDKNQATQVLQVLEILRENTNVLSTHSSTQAPTCLQMCSTLNELLMRLSVFALESSAVYSDDMKQVFTRMFSELASEWLAQKKPAHPMLTGVLCECKHYILFSTLADASKMSLQDFQNWMQTAPNSYLDLQVECACGTTATKVGRVLDKKRNAFAKLKSWVRGDEQAEQAGKVDGDEVEVVVTAQQCKKIADDIRMHANEEIRLSKAMTVHKNSRIVPQDNELTKKAIAANEAALTYVDERMKKNKRDNEAAHGQASLFMSELHTTLTTLANSHTNLSSAAGGASGSGSSRARNHQEDGAGAASGKKRAQSPEHGSRKAQKCADIDHDTILLALMLLLRSLARQKTA